MPVVGGYLEPILTAESNSYTNSYTNVSTTSYTESVTMEVSCKPQRDTPFYIVQENYKQLAISEDISHSDPDIRNFYKAIRLLHRQQYAYSTCIMISKTPSNTLRKCLDLYQTYLKKQKVAYENCMDRCIEEASSEKDLVLILNKDKLLADLRKYKKENPYDLPTIEIINYSQPTAWLSALCNITSGTKQLIIINATPSNAKNLLPPQEQLNSETSGSVTTHTTSETSVPIKTPSIQNKPFLKKENVVFGLRITCGLCFAALILYLPMKYAPRILLYPFIK